MCYIEQPTALISYSPHTTFPPCVTSPSSLMFTSMTVPFVMTPSCVYKGDWGFFLTPIRGRQKVALSSGWVTWAFLNLRAYRDRGEGRLDERRGGVRGHSDVETGVL